LRLSKHDVCLLCAKTLIGNVDSRAAFSVVSISDFQVKDGVEVEEGTGSGIVWDRSHTAIACIFMIGLIDFTFRFL